MKRAMLGVAALAALAVTSVAVATLRSGDVAQVSATLSATTAANVQTRTFTCDNQTIEITTGRWTGTASSATADLNGPVELHLKSVYNVTKKLGWIDGRLKLRAADDRTSAYLTGVNVDGKVDGWLRGSAGHRDGVLFGSLAGSFSKTGGFTGGTIGSGTGANAARDREAHELQGREAGPPERAPRRARQRRGGQRDLAHGQAERRHGQPDLRRQRRRRRAPRSRRATASR